MRILLLGYGSIGKRHHDLLKDIDPNLQTDIVDPRLGYNQSKHKTYDWGLVCTDTSLHIENALKLKDKCGFLFIEKPLHTSLDLIKKHERDLSSIPIHVGCNIRYTSAIERFKTLREEARLVRVTSMSNLLSWREDSQKRAYSFHKSMGGGALMDFVHEPDYVRFVLGNPINSSVYSKRTNENVTVDSDDSCMMTWEYDKTLVSFTLSYCSKSYVRKIEVLKNDMSEELIEIKKEDIAESYKKQWIDIFNSGPKNSYDDCLQLYEHLLRQP